MLDESDYNSSLSIFDPFHELQFGFYPFSWKGKLYLVSLALDLHMLSKGGELRLSFMM